ncbi:HBL061Cp [Eremothecium sinecaudum]|uniref:HBL061Cp n=1 Tax=Eremothecium sinecaudum TaxID=45286 RepID=A0A120K102_9SACH|nr:HBL061Cp [Eremothecium sinecaudum]AMD18841.1 HBL061Cp [Eremothecium sinecaudum]
MITEVSSDNRTPGSNQRVPYLRQLQQYNIPSTVTANTTQGSSRDARARLEYMKSFMDDHMFFIESYDDNSGSSGMAGQAHLMQSGATFLSTRSSQSVFNPSCCNIYSLQQPYHHLAQDDYAPLPGTTIYGRQRYLQRPYVTQKQFPQRQHNQEKMYLASQKGGNQRFGRRGW